MDKVADYAIAMLYKAQKAIKMALDVEESLNKYPEETESLRMKLQAVNWLIGKANERV